MRRCLPSTLFCGRNRMMALGLLAGCICIAGVPDDEFSRFRQFRTLPRRVEWTIRYTQLRQDLLDLTVVLDGSRSCSSAVSLFCQGYMDWALPDMDPFERCLKPLMQQMPESTYPKEHLSLWTESFLQSLAAMMLTDRRKTSESTNALMFKLQGRSSLSGSRCSALISRLALAYPLSENTFHALKSAGLDDLELDILELLSLMHFLFPCSQSSAVPSEVPVSAISMPPAALPPPYLWLQIQGGHRLIEVAFLPHLDGGGSYFGLDYLRFLNQTFSGYFNRAFEWCGGAGFIGFHLLAHGIIEHLTLSDINEAAVAAVRRTISRNRLEKWTMVYVADGLESLPADELGSWDLVIGNPPHFQNSLLGFGGNTLKEYDWGWDLHSRFFASVGNFLAPGAHVVLQESYEGSDPKVIFDLMHSIPGQQLEYLRSEQSQYVRYFFFWAWLRPPVLHDDDDYHMQYPNLRSNLDFIEEVKHVRFADHASDVADADCAATLVVELLLSAAVSDPNLGFVFNMYVNDQFFCQLFLPDASESVLRLMTYKCRALATEIRMTLTGFTIRIGLDRSSFAAGDSTVQTQTNGGINAVQTQTNISMMLLDRAGDNFWSWSNHSSKCWQSVA